MLDILVNKRLVLSDPREWEDRNDAYYLRQYKQHEELKTLLVICFSMRRETRHHWRAFADGIAGACIEFDKAKLVSMLETDRGLKGGMVHYPTMAEQRNDPPSVQRLPFLKRLPFVDESEYRIIYQDKRDRFDTYELKIEPSMILKITLSPHMMPEVAKSVKHILRHIEGCSKLEINRSSLLESERWKEFADLAK